MNVVVGRARRREFQPLSEDLRSVTKGIKIAFKCRSW